jgi:GDP-L-fucose synthase
MSFWQNKRVVVTGGFGFVGSFVARKVASLGAKAIACSRRAGCDLRRLDETLDFFRHHAPHIVINCAANQGGLAYQKLKPASLYRDNILINLNTMEAAAQINTVEKYVNIVAGCAYPGQMGQDAMREDMLFNRPVHPSVQTYGSVKRATVVQGVA